ncbi:MAG: M23 family metallopeptidase [Clostridiales bacterium]|nr:M23 family metallopeptidase [Clostridiales bacterium]
MGDYKSQYEKYYSNIKTQKNAKIVNNKKNNNTKYFKNFTRKLIIQSCGAMILLGLIMIIKAIPLEETKEAYIISKEVLDENFNINEAVMAINVPEFEDYKEKTLDFIDSIKVDITGQKSLKEKIKEEFIPPLLGQYREIEGEDVGVIIENLEVKDVLSSFNGKISEIKEEEEGYHVIVDNGNGIETYYGLLSEVNIKKGEKINKGQSIGKSSEVNNNGKSGIVFKIIYFGKEKNPWDLLDFSKLERV